MKKIRHAILSGVLLLLFSTILRAQGVEVRWLDEKDELLKKGYFGVALETKPYEVNQYLIDSLKLDYELRLANISLQKEYSGLLKPVAAFEISVNISSDDEKTTYKISNGTISKQTIILKGAAGITLNFGNLTLNRGSQIVIYDSSKRFIIGPIDGDRFHSVNKYITEIIPGDEVHIELFTPNGHEKSGYQLSGLFFHTLFEDGFSLTNDEPGQKLGDTWDPCYINSVCPLGESFSDERDAVVRIRAFTPAGQYPSASFWGSGVLVGNTAYNNEPYILTARHNIDIDGNGLISFEEENALSLMQLRFFHESGQCPHPYLPPQVDIGYTFVNASLIAENPNTDMVLLKINNADLNTRFYFAGWKANSHIPYELYSLSHPEALSMKISKSNDPSTNSTQFSESGVTIPAHHAYKLRWDAGCVSGGSSGGPYFDGNGFVIGTHTGSGPTLFGKRYYGGRLSHAWSALGQILDPINNGSILSHNGRRPHSITGPVLLCGTGTYHFEYLSTGIDTNEITWSVPAFSATGTGTKATIYVTGNEEPGRWWITFSSPRQNGGEITLTKEFVLSGLDLSPYTNVQVYDTEDIPVPMEYGVFMLDLNEEYRLYASTYTGSPFYAPVTNWNWNIPIDWELLSNDPSFSEIRIKTPSEISPLMLRQGDPATVDVFDNYCQIWNYSAGWANYGYKAPPPEGFVFAFSPNPILNTIHIKRISKEVAHAASWIILTAENSGIKIPEEETLVRILNEHGLVYEKRYNLKEISIELGTLPQGLYFIHVFAGEEVFRGKFIKDRYDMAQKERPKIEPY